MMENISSFQLGIDLDIKPSKAQSEVDAASVSEYQAADSSDHFVSRDGMTFAGTHLLIDLWGARRLDDLAHVEAALREAVAASRATLLHIHLHHFTPNGGVSGVAVLAESHISIHTWPERGYAALDVFMCGDADPQATIPVLDRAFSPARVEVDELRRGHVK
ncbi:MAG: adenosylmethionine decarboxylase [Alphaproteobacteria bacterium]|nr:adenosylmethionine decarboxylase [Alphaproteobacteria bacterium]